MRAGGPGSTHHRNQTGLGQCRPASAHVAKGDVSLPVPVSAVGCSRNHCCTGPPGSDRRSSANYPRLDLASRTSLTFHLSDPLQDPGGPHSAADRYLTSWPPVLHHLGPGLAAVAKQSARQKKWSEIQNCLPNPRTPVRGSSADPVNGPPAPQEDAGRLCVPRLPIFAGRLRRERWRVARASVLN